MNINNNVPFLIVTYIPSKYETNIDKILMGAYIDWMSVAQNSFLFRDEKYDIIYNISLFFINESKY